MAEDILENQSKKGNGLVLVIIIVILLLLLVVGGLLAFLLMGNSEDTAQAQTMQAQTEQVQASTPKNTAGKRSNDYINMGPVYPLDQFIVNLLSESGSRYLKTKVDLELSAETLTPEIDKKKPLIRDIIVSTLSSKTYEEVSTQKGKNRLKDEIDIVAISRISKLKERRGEDFLRYFLNDEEISIAKTDATIAGFFAAKEAISKALGCGISAEFSFFDAQIYKDDKNAPKVKFSEKIIKNFNVKGAEITISHDGGFAIAAAILQRK